MIRYTKGMSGKIRVARARKTGRFTNKRNKRNSLLIRLRGWQGVFKQLNVKWKDGRRPFRITKVRDMTPTDRKDFLAACRMKGYWYTRCYMIGKGGLCRKLAIKQRLISRPRPRPAPGVVRRRKKM